MTPVRVAAYEPARRPELSRLLAAVWGRPPVDDELEWWLERNPAGEAIVSLAEDDGRLVGVACMSPYRLQVGGRELTALVPLHVATHPEHRRRGVFSTLERANEERAAGRAAVAITFPNAASAAVFRSRLGWVDLPGPRVWARPATRRRLPRGVRRVRAFGPEADELWRALAPRYGNSLVRDAAYLSWRFAAAPRDYACLAADDGVAVVGRRRLGPLPIAYVAELVAAPGAPARRLLRAALAVAEAAVLLTVPPLGGASDLLRLGFVPTPKRILVLGKALRAGVALPRRWTFSLGDGDSF